MIKYSSRTFNEYREDLANMIRERYPDVFSDFTDSSVGSILIDLNAGIADNLSTNTDRVFMETQLTHAQKRSSILEHAKRLGFNIPGKRPSVTLVDFMVEIPVLGDAPDASYYPVLLPGAVITGGGRSFETQDVVDWSSPVDALGHPNRKIVPNLDSNGIIQYYNVTKREVVINGKTKIHKRVIRNSDIRPFFSLQLPDNDVIGIENVILLSGTNYNDPPNTPTFFDDDIRYYEVDYLAQQRIFLESQKDKTDELDQTLRVGKWKHITRKFIKEYTSNGYCRLIFGAGDAENDKVREYLTEGGLGSAAFIEGYLNNTALGERLKPDHTLFIRYRTGGGSGSNLGRNTLNSIDTFNLIVTGNLLAKNKSVRRSLSVTNPIPAVGGRDELDIEEIRYLVKYNLAAKNKCVTLNDYKLMLHKMPGRFGTPFKSSIYKENNKVLVTILGIDSNGKLGNTSNKLLKRNIAEYLTEYRMINDFVEVVDGKIYNISFDIEVFVEDLSDSQISNNIIRAVSDYFNIRKNEMNRDVYIGRLEEKLLSIPGVVNIIDIKAYNRVGGEYSANSMSLDLVNENTDEIFLKNNTIYSSKNSMFEIKFPEKDIRIYLRKRNI